MSPEVASLVTRVGRVAPISMQYPKRFAKALHKLFPHTKLSLCQASTAHVYGFSTWHDLEESAKASTQLGAFDEDLDQEALRERTLSQARILMREIAQVDPFAEYRVPVHFPFPLLSLPHDQDDLVTMSIDVACKYLDQVICTFFVNEQAPTASQDSQAAAVSDCGLVLASQNFMASYPQRIARWWRVNLPLSPEVADDIEQWPWNKDLASNVAFFARHWGLLTMGFAGVISPYMGLGTAYLLAQQFAAILYSNHGTDHGIRKAHEKLSQQMMGSYPCVDFWSAGVEAHTNSARTVVEILSDPNSRSGIWPN